MLKTLTLSRPITRMTAQHIA